MSAIGNEAPIAFAVSPLYQRTHFVAAVAVAVGGCDSGCTHLWISRDGGASWRRTGVLSGGGGRIAIVESRPGVESIAVSNGDQLMGSDDDGATWRGVGGAGTPAETTAFGADSLVVANPQGSDYVLSGSAVQPVTGSGGAYADLELDVPPVSTSSRFPPALLAADDPHTGAPVVLQCDGSLRCSNPTILPGADPRTGGDMSLLLAANYATSGVAYARTTSGIYRSSDGGRRFLPLPLPQQTGAVYTTVPTVALGGAGMSRLYAAVLSVVGTGRPRLTAGGVYASVDSGVTWSAVGTPGPLDGGATSVAATPDGRLFAGYVDADGDAGLVCSVEGRRWQASCPAKPTTCASACGLGSATRSTQSATAAPGASVAADAGPLGTGAIAPQTARTDMTTTDSPPRSASHLAAGVLLLIAGLASMAGFNLISTRRRTSPRS